MDAPTTTSADNGSSGGSSGDWGWFTPASKKSSAENQSRQNARDGRQSALDNRNDRGERDERAEAERMPTRPVNPIRPVGTAAERVREPEPQRVPQQGPAPQREPGRQAGDPAYAERSAAPYAEQAAPAPAPTPAPVPASAYAPPRREAEPEPVHEPESAREPEPVHEPVRNPFDPFGAPYVRTTQTTSTPPSPVAASTPPSPVAASAPSPPSAASASPAPKAAPTPPPPAASPAPAAPAPPAPEPTLSAVAASASATEPASPDAILIRRTMSEIEPVADKVTSYFYALLFVRHPDLRALFPASMDTQRDRLFKALLTAAQHVDDAAVLTEYLSHLGRGHRKYGTQPDHYPAVGECLLAALSRYATSSWSPEAEAAWVRAYTAISQIMIDAAAENETVAPAWWQAEVVSHELRTPDTAVVTVRPDQPYPFRAGQYTSLETPWWPRVWRHYSFASAPRSDGLLSFHVKAVPAGWVSNAMVHRARPGDVLRLGAPAGSMTVDHTSRTGLLCVGGGTGIAPIKALIEDVAQHGARRPVDVFYGARSEHDLYDIDTMLRLDQTHPWLSVRPVVAIGPGTRGGPGTITGQLPDAVRQYGPYREYDAYLSGPPGLIRSGVDALVGVGVPSDRIRHDSIEELVSTGD
ncbi:globin domain-containing protein [Streptomyces sp. CT34]|uniref:globin domain-containing protein n=1 Tax=Streptomyces sp. CT34 TaxID=1553907 RepID=UPI0005BBF6DD|nr:globin domain-containing protein [Streptomyces sp. CT34]